MKIPALPRPFIATLLALTLASQPDSAAQTTRITKLHGRSNTIQTGGIFSAGLAITPRWIVVGEVGHQAAGLNTGAIHVFDGATGIHRRLIVCPEPEASAQFGLAIAIEGDLALVAAPQAGAAGKVYLFHLRTGALLRIIPPPGGNYTSFKFGSSVALHDGKAAIGDPECQFGGMKTGAVFHYDLADESVPPTILIPSDALAGDQFGASLSLSGDLLLAGAHDHNAGAGAAYLFEVPGSALLRKFTGVPGDRAGVSVALAGGRAAVGAPGSDLSGTDSGVVRVYHIETGGFLFNLIADDADAGHLLGYSLAANHDLIVAGAPGHLLPGGGINAGAAYAFDSRTGDQIQRLLNPGRMENDWSGYRTAVCGQRVLVGNLFADDLGPETGSATLYAPVAGRLSLTVMATQLDSAPGLVDSQHAAFGDAVINQTGRTAFTGSLRGAGASAGRNRAAYSALIDPASVENVLRSGIDLQGFDNAGRFATAFARPLISETPRAYFQTRLRGAGTTRAGNLFFFSATGGAMGTTATPLLTEGAVANWSGGATVSRIGQIILGSNGAADPVALFHLRDGTGAATLANDTGLVSIAFDGNANSTFPEGAALVGGGQLGQVQRAAVAESHVVVAGGIMGDPAAPAGLFRYTPATGSHTTLLRQGQPAVGVTGGTHRAFLGETVALDGWVLHRGTVDGPGITPRNRECLWLRQPLFPTVLVARAGDPVPGLAPGITWSRFLAYWPCNDKRALIYGTVRGPGVNTSNDAILWLRQEDGSARLLLREGDTLPDCQGARVAVIQRVTAESKLGAYSVLVSLRGAPRGRDQVLMQGRVGGTALALAPLRQPFPRFIKGGLYQFADGVPLSLASINWSTSIQDTTGAGAKGLGNVINPFSQMTLHARFSDRRSSILVGRP